MKSNQSIFFNKQVLITGHTGFKGSWIALWLTQLGAKVSGVSFDIPTTPSNHKIINNKKYINEFTLDINNFDEINEVVQQIQPDYVFHLAAQALVRHSYSDPLKTLKTNALGTAHILESLRSLERPVVAIMITSDKAYDNVEWKWGYREIDRLGGKDPYSASKGMAELVIRSYVESFLREESSKIRVGITRAGNVIGGGDWAKDRIVPDCMQAWSKNNAVDIRSPHATRPWQHVLEPLSGYLSLAVALTKSDKYHGEAYNFGPSSVQNHSVANLIEEMKQYWSNVNWHDKSSEQYNVHEAGLLKLNCDKALFDLQWNPTLLFKETIYMTVDWYKAFYENTEESMRNYAIEQISEYTRLAIERNNNWINYD